MAVKFDWAVESGTEDGIEWATVNAPLYGAVNGYVKLPEGHPWRELELQMGEGEVDVHGGITYGPDPDGWCGFDTLHYQDNWPGSPNRDFDGIDWDAGLVAAEAKRLARQAAAVIANV